MSRFAQPILPDNSSGIASAPYLGSPRIPNTGAGLAASLAGAGTAMSAVAGDIERRRLEEEREADRRARMEEATRDAADQRYLIELENRLLTQRVAGKAAAADADPVQAGQAFDESMRPILEEIDAIERPDLAAKARLQYTRAYLPGRESVGEIAARRMADASRASVAALEQTLTDGVVLGDEEPEAAIARHTQAVNGLVGTAYTQEQAVAATQQFRSSVVSRYVDRLIDASAEDPAMAEPLRDFLGGDLAKTTLTANSRARIVDSLDKAERDGQVRQWRTRLQGSRQGVTAALLADDTPDFVAATADPEGTIETIDGLVADLMAMPGREADSSPEKPAMSEAALRASLLGETIEAAASSGNEALFELAVMAARVPTVEGRIAMQPELASKVARLRETLVVAEKKRSEATMAVDAISGAWATGESFPLEYLRSEALDAWAKEAMVRSPASVVAGWLASEGAIIPQSVVSRVQDGFAEGAQGPQIEEAISVLQAIGRADPEAARRVASSAKASDAALTVLDLGGDAAMARVLLSPEGAAGLSAARQALGKGIAQQAGEDRVIVNQAEAFDAMGHDISAFGLPASASRAFEAGFRFSMASRAASGVDVSSQDAVDSAAREAVSRVTATHADIRVTEMAEHSWYMGGRDIDGTVFVDAAMFGVPPSSIGADSSTEALTRMLSDAQGSLNPAFFAPTGIVRPDLALTRTGVGSTGLESEVLVPLVDHASLSPVEFVGWDPIGKRWTRNVKPGNPDFPKALDAFNRRTPLDAIDYDSRFRRPRGSIETHVSDWEPAIADLFERTMTARYQSVASGDVSLATYLEMQAMSLGWQGFRKPPEGEQ